MNLKKFIKKYYDYFILIGIPLVLIIPLVISRSVIVGSDTIFHFNRFYDASLQIQNLNFQPFISEYGYQQSGRVVNAIYGPMFAFFQGFILFISKNWFIFGILSSSIMLILTSLLMYYLLRTNKADKNISIILSLIYTMSFYGIHWITKNEMTSVGATFLPIGIAAATRMVRNKKNQVNIFELTLGVTLIAQTHMLSLLELIIVLFIFFIIGFIISEQRLTLVKDVVISALITIVMTANVWIAYIELYLNNVMLRPYIEKHPLNKTFFFKPGFSLQKKELLGFTNPLWIMLVLYFILLIFVWKRTNLLIKTVSLTSIFFFLLSSRILNWDQIFIKYPFISIIQFPSRMSVIGYIFLLLGIGLVLTMANKNFYNISKWFLIIVLISSSFFSLLGISYRSLNFNSEEVLSTKSKLVINAETPKELRKKMLSNDKSDFIKAIEKSSPDYVPLHSKKDMEKLTHSGTTYKRYENEIILNQYNNKHIENGEIVLLFDKYNNSKEQQLPLIIYNHTKVYLNNKLLSKKDFKTTRTGSLIIDSNYLKNGENKVSIHYEENKITRMLIIISFVSWIIFIVSYFYYRILRIKKRQSF